MTLVDVEARRDTRVMVAVGAAALAFDLAVRSGIACVAGTLCVAVLAVGLAASGRLHNPQARALAAAAPVFGAFLLWRDSPWLLLPDIAAAGLLLLGAASFASEGSVADIGSWPLVRRLFDASANVLGAPGFVVESLRTGRPGAGAVAVGRGALFAAPVVVVLGLLLSSADAVFASFFRVSFDLPSVGMHVFLAALGAVGMATLLRASSRPALGVPAGGLLTAVVLGLVVMAMVPLVAVLALAVCVVVALAWGGCLLVRTMGSVERVIALGAVVALYSTFALAQLVAASEGGERVLRTAGLTYAQYARSGFFQLLVVAGLTLLILFALDNGTRVVRTLSGVAVGLTLVIVFVAVRRLRLYEDAFGLTMLRLYCTVFAVWIGAVFVLFEARLLRVGGTREWWASAAVATGLAMLFVLNVLNPEALVVRRNAAREKFDTAYAASLSADAVPALVARGSAAQVCPQPERGGWLGWNRAQAQAEAACRRAPRLQL